MFHKEKLNEVAGNMINKAQDTKEQAKQSGQDWLGYVMEHPLQSMLFGAVIGLAIKGLLKK